ncbi:MAG: hypothetical protein ACK4NU_04850 [Brevundimonas sp.]
MIGRAEASRETNPMRVSFMKRRLSFAPSMPAAVLVIGLAACGQPAAADRQASESSTDIATTTPAAALVQAATPAIAGAYRMEGARVGDLTLEEVASGWKIRLRGGVPTDMGAATPADCELQAEGPLVGDRIEGAVVPFEGYINSISAEDLQGHTYDVTVRISGGTASVTTNYDGCGMGADLSGDYKRAAGG